MADLVKTNIYYAIPPADGVRAFLNTAVDPITGEWQKNYARQAQEMQVENIRGKEDSVSLDTAGFQFYTAPSKYKGEFLDEEEIKREYYLETEEILKKLTGASKVVIFDHTIRQHRPGETDSPSKRQPVQQAHVDQTFAAAIARVQRHLPPDEALELLKRRFQIINLWRPISVPALDWPLALCDFRSVDDRNDVFPVALIYPDREGQTYSVKYNPDHKWKYLRGMTPDDIVLIKCADSIQDGSVAKFTPHTAFQDPAAPEGAPRRQSIEIRTLVFYD